jgi:hypothetical protein
MEGAKKSILDTLGVILAASGVEPAVRGVQELVRESGGNSGEHGSRSRRPRPGGHGRLRQRLHGALPGFRRPRARRATTPAARSCLRRWPWPSAAAEFRAQADHGRGRRAGHVPAAAPQRRVEAGLAPDDGVSACIPRQPPAAHVLGLDADGPPMPLALPACSPVARWSSHTAWAATCAACTPASARRARCSPRCWRRKGTQGIRSVFEGKAGLFNVYFEGRYDRAKMLQGLGSEFGGGSILFKPWPSCGASHGFIHATLGPDAGSPADAG